ncbi:MAG: hypothetical protein ACXACI_17905 [Candidatus Hodarchaeales archaeon]|jgi:hypothetical protein
MIDLNWIKSKKCLSGLALLFVLPLLMPNPGTAYVDQYQIVSVAQTDVNEITATVQARFCGACNPNPTSDPNARYVKIWIKDSGGTTLGTQQMTCNTTNWPLTVTHQEDFVFAISVTAGETVTVYADIFCNWCGHYYPTPVSTTVIDLVPPEIVLKEGQIVLWPPNHKYHRITVWDFIESVSDNYDDLDIADVVITSVSSDEPEDVKGNGDGKTLNDMIIVNDQTVALRAERQGAGNGRVYTIHFELVDSSGNVASGSVEVWVPHDLGAGSMAINDGPVYWV